MLTIMHAQFVITVQSNVAIVIFENYNWNVWKRGPTKYKMFSTNGKAKSMIKQQKYFTTTANKFTQINFILILGLKKYKYHIVLKWIHYHEI